MSCIRNGIYCFDIPCGDVVVAQYVHTELFYV